MKRKIDDLGRIVLPAEMKKEIGLENGAEANIEVEDHKIIITKPDSIDYKAIVDKAIEYIKNANYKDESIWVDDLIPLFKILKGEDNE